MIAWSERALAIDPHHLLACEYMASAWLMKGDLDRHMEESLAHAKAAGAPTAMLDELKQLYASGGRPAIVGYALRQNAKSPSVQLTLMFGEAGRADEAFQQLRLALESHDPSLVYLAVAPQWDVLRGDPRFAELLRSTGLTSLRRVLFTRP